MKIHKKAHSFVESLGLKILSGKKAIGKASTKSKFIDVIQSLPDNKLKNELLSNIDGYHEELCRILQSSTSGASSANAEKDNFECDTSLPFNVFLNNKRIKKKTLHGHSEESSMQIYSLYLLETYSNLHDVSELKKLLKHCQPVDDNSTTPVWVEQVRKLCAIYSGCVESSMMQIIMKFFHGHITDEDIGSSDIPRLEVLKESIISFLTYCHMKPVSAKEFSKPSYGDLLAAILSVYVDIVLITSRDADEGTKQATGRRLCSTLLHLVDPHYHLGLDVVVQLDNVTPADSTVLGPFCRRLLEKPQRVEEPDIYTRYITGGRTIRRQLPNIVDDLILTLNDIRAPKGYLDWLRDRDERILSKLPVDKRFKRTKITKFLLGDAEDSIIDNLLDILTEPTSDKPCEEGAMDVDTSTVDTGTAQATDFNSYCFIDRSGNVCLDADAAAANEDNEKMEIEEQSKEAAEASDLEDEFGIIRNLREIKKRSIQSSQLISSTDLIESSEADVIDTTINSKEKKSPKKREKCGAEETEAQEPKDDAYANSKTEKKKTGKNEKRRKSKESCEQRENTDTHEEELRIDGMEVEEESDALKLKSEEKKRKRYSDQIQNADNEQSLLLADLGEICRKGDRSRRSDLEKYQSEEHGACGNKDRREKVVDEKASDLEREFQTGGTISSEAEKSGTTQPKSDERAQQAELNDPETNSSSSNKKTKRTKTHQQDDMNTEADISSRQQLNLVASLSDKDTSDRNEIIFAPDANAVDAATVLRTSQRIQSPLRQQLKSLNSPELRVESPTKRPSAAEAVRGEEIYTATVTEQILRQSSLPTRRSSIDSPTKLVRNFVTPEIVEADSSFELSDARRNSINNRSPRKLSTVDSREVSQQADDAVVVVVESPLPSPRHKKSLKHSAGQSPVRGDNGCLFWRLGGGNDEPSLVHLRPTRGSRKSESNTQLPVQKTSETESNACPDIVVRQNSVDAKKKCPSSPEIPFVGTHTTAKSLETSSRRRSRSCSNDHTTSLIPDLSKYLKKPQDSFEFHSDADDVPPRLSDYRRRTRSLSGSNAESDKPPAAVAGNKLVQTDIRNAFGAKSVASARNANATAVDATKDRKRNKSRSSNSSEQTAKTDCNESSLVNVSSPCRRTTDSTKSACVSSTDKSTQQAQLNDEQQTPKSKLTKQTTSSTKSNSHRAAVASEAKNSQYEMQSPLSKSAKKSATPTRQDDASLRTVSPARTCKLGTLETSTADTARCRLFDERSSTSATATETKTVLPEPAAESSEKPSCSTKSSAANTRKRGSSVRSPALVCDTTIRRSARLSSKASHDDSLSNSQTSVTSSQSIGTPSRKRTTSISSPADASGKRPRV